MKSCFQPQNFIFLNQQLDITLRIPIILAVFSERSLQNWNLMLWQAKQKILPLCLCLLAVKRNARCTQTQEQTIKNPVFYGTPQIVKVQKIKDRLRLSQTRKLGEHDNQIQYCILNQILRGEKDSNKKLVKYPNQLKVQLTIMYQGQFLGFGTYARQGNIMC